MSNVKMVYQGHIEVRKIRGHAKGEITSIDSIKDNGQIADKFPKQLFNINPSNPEDLRAMMESLCTNIRTDPKSDSD